MAANAVADSIRGQERKEFSAPDAEMSISPVQHTILQDKVARVPRNVASVIDGRVLYSCVRFEATSRTL